MPFVALPVTVDGEPIIPPPHVPPVDAPTTSPPPIPQDGNPIDSPAVLPDGNPVTPPPVRTEDVSDTPPLVSEMDSAVSPQHIPQVPEGNPLPPLPVLTDDTPFPPVPRKVNLILPPPPPVTKPAMIGVHGLPASGKSFLLEELKRMLGEEHYQFYEHREVAQSLLEGTDMILDNVSSRHQSYLREKSVIDIKAECAASGKTPIVASDLTLWCHDESRFRMPNDAMLDLSNFTHIIYLDPNVQTIAQRVRADTANPRTEYSTQDLQEWQDHSIRVMREFCYRNQVLFLRLQEEATLAARVAPMIRNFREISGENANWKHVESRLDELIPEDDLFLETALVMDGDETLSSFNTNHIFWNMDRPGAERQHKDTPAMAILRRFGQSEHAFRQITLLHEEFASDERYEARCQAVAAACRLRPEFELVFKWLQKDRRILPIVVTSGPARIWELILDHAGFSDTIKVIGGGRVSDKIFVSPTTTVEVVKWLQSVHKLYVCALGDSPSNMPMLAQSDEPVVVIGDDWTRNSIMDPIMMDALKNGVQLKQVPIPNSVSPRFNSKTLPCLIMDYDFYRLLVVPRPNLWQIEVLRKRDDFEVSTAQVRNLSARKLLMAPFLNERLSGHLLDHAHLQAGRYLATELLTEALGVEEGMMNNGRGGASRICRLVREDRTCIIPVTPESEAMALGIHEVFPTAMRMRFQHPREFSPQHIALMHHILLVDPNIRKGRILIEHIQHIRSFNKRVNIVVISGLVSSCKLLLGHPFGEHMSAHNIPLAAVHIKPKDAESKDPYEAARERFSWIFRP